MNEVAAQLVDELLPDVRYRQWTLSFPKRIRFRLAKEPALFRDVIAIAMGKIFSYQRKKARGLGVVSPRCGAIAFQQRFGSLINLHPHMHSAIPDAVFSEEPDASVKVWELPPPTDDEVATLLLQIARAIEKRIAKEDDEMFLDLDTAEEDAVVSEVLASLSEPRLPPKPFTPPKKRPRCAFLEGYSLDANVWVNKGKRASLERVLRYMARPSFAAKRLSVTPDGNVAYKLSKPWYTGQTQITFEPLEFLKRLAALIPPPRKNTIAYFGVFAPNAKLRQDVCALVPKWEDEAAQEQLPLPNMTPAPRIDEPIDDDEAKGFRRIPWAQLLKRTFAHDLLVCTKCNGKRKVLAMVREPDGVKRLLVYHGFPSEAPKLAPARAPPQVEMFDAWDPDVVYAE